MDDEIDHWNREHANFALLLDLFERELDVFHQGGSADYEMMSDIMFYMSHYSGQVHHPREDLAFARVREREPELTPVIDELASQHAELKTASDAVTRALDGIVNGSIDSRDHLEIPARRYVDVFRDHMRQEETALLPVVARLLRQRDWAVIDAQIRRIEDPLFGKAGQERYAALRKQIAREARFAVDAATP